ncbi:MAG: DNA-directed DNA polymerase II small subunit [archaeon]
MMNNETVKNFLEQGYLISPDMMEEEVDDKFLQDLDKKIRTATKPIVINKDIHRIINKTRKPLEVINWNEFEKSRALMEKGKNGKVYETFLDLMGYNIDGETKEKLDTILEEIKKPEEEVELTNGEGIEYNVIVLESYKEGAKKREVQDFVTYFKSRYNSLKEILMNRSDLQNTVSINRLTGKTKVPRAEVIGIIMEKRTTKNGSISLTIEDPTGQITVIVNKNKPELVNFAKNLVEDEVIGIKGGLSGQVIFANEILVPDIPLTKEKKKAPEEAYAIFLSDLHIGSNLFLAKDFMRFVDWINCKSGSKEQKEVAKKTKYMFIVGDIVDGVGIYPEQDKELAIKDIRKQYEKAAELIGLIRKDIKIVVCPGNHDALRISEPQPALGEDMAPDLLKIPNVMMVSNPALINIHSSKDFPGFDVLMYHGYSFDYYASNVDYIRMGGGYDKPELIMRFLLQKRHLAPTHASTLYVPDSKDVMVINKAPDFFITGHIHRAAIGNYNNITMVCSSCWQSKTAFQEKVGHHPEPSRVPIVNLKTREIKMLKFSS